MVKTKKRDFEAMKKWSYLLFRVSFGLFFFFAGLPKLTALFAGNNPLGGMGIPVFLSWIVAIVEVVGGAFLVLGFIPMISGVLIAITMLVAAAMTSVVPFVAKGLFQHLLYVFGALVLGMQKDTFLSIGCLWKKK